MATVHLICGLPCSGKSTYSRALALTTLGVHLCLDKFLITSYGSYSISVVGHEEHIRRVQASRRLIWDLAKELLARNIDAILDDGFFLKETRLRYAAEARACDAFVNVHFLDTQYMDICERLTNRNATLPDDNFRIDTTLLKTFLEIFEAPTVSEGLPLTLIRPDNELLKSSLRAN